jgi:hypothetical protein
MAHSFHLLDLISQARAVKDLLRGRSHEEKIAWLVAHGHLERREVQGREIYARARGQLGGRARDGSGCDAAASARNL